MATKAKLKRTLGFWEVTFFGVGIILGAGIYALIGAAAGITGNATWLAFVISAIVGGFTALSYAELSAMFPHAGAEYVYVEKSFKKEIAFLVGWMIIIGTVLGAATVSLGFAGYLSVFLKYPIIPVAIALIGVSTFVNIYGIKESAIIGVIFSIIEVVGLIAVIIIGLPYLGDVDYTQMPMDGIYNLFISAALVFFAYLGFETIPRLSEETKDPEKTIPSATLLSLAISTVIYVLVAIVAVSVVPWDKLATSHAPLAEVASIALGNNARMLLAITALFATANTVLLMLVTDSRLLYGMANEGILPKKLANVHLTQKTPWIAAIVVGGLSMFAVLAGDITFLANSTNFTVLVTFTIINLSVIWFNYREPAAKRPYLSPRIGSFPVSAVFGTATSILLLSSTGINAIIAGSIVILVGLLFYLAMRQINRVVRTK